MPPSSRPAPINLVPIDFLTSLPPLTDPVNKTWSILLSPIIFEVDAWSKWRYWNTLSGKADFSAASNNCSAQRGVCDECLVQVSYAIGLSEPMGIYINTYGTSNIDLNDDDVITDEEIEKAKKILEKASLKNKNINIY